MNLSVALVLASILSTGRADCPSGGSFDPAALRVVVVNAGEDDPAVARAVAELGANMVATVSPPNLRSALAAQAAGLAYLPWLSSREVARLPFDVARVEAIRRMPAIAGLHYLDEDVTEGYTSAATQARTYGILKALFPDRLALYATRLDPIATDPGYLAGYYRPEFTDLVVPYFYPVGTTVLGTYEESDPWEARLRSLLEPLAAATPEGKPMLPLLQAFEQNGHPVGGGLPLRQHRLYQELWPENRNVAAFWWGGPTDELLLGISDLPPLARALRWLFGTAPSRPAPCALPSRTPLESPP